jgi:hypothetical protein
MVPNGCFVRLCNDDNSASAFRKADRTRRFIRLAAKSVDRDRKWFCRHEASSRADEQAHRSCASRSFRRVRRNRWRIPLASADCLNTSGVEREVRSFANLRRAVSPGARLTFVCWRSLMENPRMEVPMRVVAPHVPPRPKSDPQAPECSPSPSRIAFPKYLPQLAGRAAARKARSRSGHRCRPRAGGGCGSIYQNRRR